ncbi:NAD(P)-dependent oxidoreductase [Rickettsiales bacterium]|nr:NAD(P)-dependent oxidoreductase [Rickettsiales bacterium]
MTKIVILDQATITKGDLKFDAINNIAHTTCYDMTNQDQIIDRCMNAQILITNKVAFDHNIIKELPQLKMISIFATGYDKIDIDECKANNIAVANVPDYSSYSVVQTILAHLLNITQKLPTHSNFVNNGNWSKSEIFSCWQGKIHELAGKTIGIIGFGNIGRKLANVAKALGMNVIINTANPNKYHDYSYNFVGFDQILKESDVISLNLPASKENNNIINSFALSKMKNSAILINCSRGTLINELDLAHALQEDEIAYACLDVLSEEPPQKSNPLINCKNCQITPHIAWATVEARTRIIEETALNIKAFLANEQRNRIV